MIYNGCLDYLVIMKSLSYNYLLACWTCNGSFLVYKKIDFFRTRISKIMKFFYKQIGRAHV